MAVYFITGKLGSGKTLSTVGKIRDYLQQCRRVATNLDIFLEGMLPESSKQSIIRLPDKPRLCDLDLLGQGCEEENEDRYGLIVLDELGTWFNSREWRDKERLPVIDWFLHARKHHWDVFFIVQDIESIDGQLVNALCEHYVNCSRTDRLTIPYIGPMLKFMGINKVLPKVHIASVYYGQSKSALRVDRWWYRARDLYPAYCTGQKFKMDEMITPLGEVVDMRASYSILPPYYTRAVEYRKLLQAELNDLGGTVSNGHIRQNVAIATVTQNWQLVSVAVLAFSLAAYGYAGKIEAAAARFADHKPAQTAPASLPVPVQPPQPIMTAKSEPPAPEQDLFQKMTDGAIVKVSSYYSDGFSLKAILTVNREGEKSLLTLDDARALGYVATVSNKILNISKPGYSLQLCVP
jgi:hypothetical protein